MKRLGLLSVLLLAVLLGGCLIEGPGTIIGDVFFEDTEQPVKDAVIVIADPEGLLPKTYSTRTNSDGHFNFMVMSGDHWMQIIHHEVVEGFKIRVSVQTGKKTYFTGKHSIYVERKQ